MYVKKTINENGSVTWYDGCFYIEMESDKKHVNFYSDGNDYTEFVYDFLISLLEKFIEDYKKNAL